MSASNQPISPIEQKELLDELTLLLVDDLPAGWLRVVLEYQKLGDHCDVGAGLRMPEGSVPGWEPPEEAWRLLNTLRWKMYTEGQGTWFSARVFIETPGVFTVNYNWDDEPDWGGAPPSQRSYLVELERNPRSAENIPEWFRSKLPVSGQ